MKELVKIAVALIISLTSHYLQGQESFNITVTIDNIDNNEGQVFLALYNSEGEFLDTSFKGTKSTIVNNTCTATFEKIPKGTYAISIFHDENNNGKMDTNFMGIPKEDYGSSNNAKGFMGPPKWKDAKFELNENKSITITL